MTALEKRIRDLALSGGAVAAGIGSRERMSDAPPSGDPGYLLPSTRSVISFAIPFDRDVLRRYFGKRDWRCFGDNQKIILQALYRTGDRLADLLRREGHEAAVVQANCTYRPEPDAGDFTEMTAFVPDFSHQYGAVAAGLGRLGLSGNLMIPGYGAAVLLGTVLTSAPLVPDPRCEDNPCDRCGCCIRVCPVGMMKPGSTRKAALAVMEETVAARGPHSRCWIGCGDYHGISPDGRWSNWSPYRQDTPLPEGKEDLDALMVRLRKEDPESGAEPNPYTDYRAVTFDPGWHFSATCGNCANVCWNGREDREENARLVQNGGLAVLRADGTREAARTGVLELETPFTGKVAILASEYARLKPGTRNRPPFRPGILPRDRAVLEHLAGRPLSLTFPGP